MYIVKETDEDSINKATELAGERSKHLADVIKNLLAFRGSEKLSVEIIEQAIDVVDGKKKLIDLIPCRPVRGLTFVRPDEEMKTTLIHYEWPPPKEPRKPSWLLYEDFKKPKETRWHSVKEHACVLNILVGTGRSIIISSRPTRKPWKFESFAGDYLFKGITAHTDITRDKLSERRMLFARSR